MRRWIPAFGVLVGTVFLAHALALACVAEDAFISFRFAHNLADGLGPIWNPGEPPVEGYTNFLWVLVSALLLSLRLDPALGSQVLGVAASLGTLLYTHRCGVRLLGWSSAAALAPCLFLALSGPFATWAGGGMETNLFGLLLLAGVYHFALYWRDARRPDLFACFAALLLAMLTRPEGMLVYALLLGVAVWASRGRRSATLRDFAAPVLLSLGLFGVYFAWRWSYYGHPLPNTFYAKTGGSTAQYARGAGYVFFFLKHYGLPWLPLLLVAAWRRAKASGGSRAGLSEASVGDIPPARILLVACAAIVAAYTLYIAWVGGDYMAMYRFFVPILPFAYLLLGAAVARSMSALPGESPLARSWVAGSFAVAVLGTLVHSTPLERSLFAAPPQMHGNHRGVEYECRAAARLTVIGRFFAAYGAGPSESLATDAIGAIGFYSGLRVYGVHGLVDAEIAHGERSAGRVGTGFAGHDRRDLARVLSRQPSFVVLRQDLLPRRPKQMRLTPALTALLGSDYRLVTVWLEDERNGEAGWFGFLERRDRAQPGPDA